MARKNMVELFAGVGGFRLGLEPFGWKTVFANQWEPGKKTQWAFDCYASHFNEGQNSNQDINTVDADSIPDHELLVGGFPCQDYSVASTLVNSKGIEGKKGVLWWDIRRIVAAKNPKYILLENVDRLLKSPAKQRGRDFGIILSCLNALGYSVEWRVVNAADYGLPQRRRRTFIFATKESNANKMYGEKIPAAIIEKHGFFAKTFPVKQDTVGDVEVKMVQIPKDLVELTQSFKTEFLQSGCCRNFLAVSIRTTPEYDGPHTTLGDVLEKDVAENYYIKEKDLPKWKYMKGAKKEERTTKAGFAYNYTEGPIPYPDPIDKPSRTMLTGESTKNRSTHVIKDPQTGRLRLLTPMECERLDGFPDDWTKTGMSDRMRYFCMGNALVVGLIKKMGETLDSLD
jgi:DNA (cytosine-5)-methyltransferase 1